MQRGLHSPRIALLLFATAALAAGACQPMNPGGGCISDTSPTGTGTRVFPQASCGLDFTVRIPNACANGGCGLIIDVHGFAMDGNIQDRNTNLRRLGGDAGFVVASPTARVGGQALPSFSQAMDANLIADFAREAIGAFNLNPNRIHIGGFSQGAGISFFSICNFPDLYASAAPIAGGGGSCFANGPPIPLLQTNGMRDEFANFAGASNTRSTIVAGMA